MRIHDAIVVGVGGMGSAACWHLARRGLDVLGLEQFQIAHDRGSSHGQTRIIRKAYFEHPDYVPLLNSAYRLWHELEAESGRRLFERCGLLLVGPPDGGVLGGVRRAARAHGLTFDDVEPGAARGSSGAADAPRPFERFPGLLGGPGLAGLFEADAGFLRVEECVRAHADLAARCGATIETGATVVGWEARGERRADGGLDGGDVRVHLADGGVRAARALVFTGGPWTSRLLADLGLPLTVRRRVQLWFPTDNPAHALDAGCPAFVFDLPEGRYYGFPAVEPGLMKIAQHAAGPASCEGSASGGSPVESRSRNPGKTAQRLVPQKRGDSFEGAYAARDDAVEDPDRLERALLPEDLTAVRWFARSHLPGVHGDPVRHAVCMYTMTPDEHFILDRHPRHAGVFLAAGFSGHGFKFAAVVGSILADLVANGRTNEPIDFLALRRAGLR